MRSHVARAHVDGDNLSNLLNELWIRSNRPRSADRSRNSIPRLARASARLKPSRPRQTIARTWARKQKQKCEKSLSNRHRHPGAGAGAGAGRAPAERRDSKRIPPAAPTPRSSREGGPVARRIAEVIAGAEARATEKRRRWRTHSFPKTTPGVRYRHRFVRFVGRPAALRPAADAAHSNRRRADRTYTAGHAVGRTIRRERKSTLAPSRQIPPFSGSAPGITRYAASVLSSGERGASEARARR